MNLETITTILVDNAKTFIHRTALDMSMFPEAEVPKIYAAAAEGTLKNRDFNATGHYLYLGKQWARLLELGIPFFHSKDEEEQKAGKHFLEILTHHDKLPEATAIELGDYILQHDGEHSRFRAAIALKSGNATQRAEEVAHDFFEEGNFKDGKAFFDVTGKKLTTEEVTRFAEIALQRGRYDDAFKFYESQKLSLPKDVAKAIANSDVRGWAFDLVVEYMDKTKKTFTAQEFKEFADVIFEAGNHQKALDIYERAGKAVSSDDYKTRGEKILEKARDIESSRSSYSPGVLWPTVSTAFAYLSKNNINEAKRRITQFADSLLDQADFTRIGSNTDAFAKIYEMVELPIPVDKALKAAHLSEERKDYGEAAKFYAAAGMKDAAKRIGDIALRSDNHWQREYGSKEAFIAAGDEAGFAVALFIEHNLRRF